MTVPEHGWLIAGAAVAGAAAGFLALEVYALRTKKHSTFTESFHRYVARHLPYWLRFTIAGAGIGVVIWAVIHLLFPDASV